MEYLIIIGLSFAVLIPTAYFFYDYSRTTNDETVRSQVNQLGNKILVNAESIYGLADGSLVTVDFKYPSNIRNITVVSQNELIIRYELHTGVTEAVFFSKVPLTGAYNSTNGQVCDGACVDSQFSTVDPSGGTHFLKFISKTSYVFVNATQ
jgi:hypothetical protein